MSAQSDPNSDEQIAEELTSESIVKAANGAQAAVELLVKKILEVDTKVDQLLHPQFEFRHFQTYGTTNVVLDPEEYVTELGKDGWIPVDTPMAGSTNHPQGFIDDKTGKPFQVPTVLVFCYRRVPQK